MRQGSKSRAPVWISSTLGLFKRRHSASATSLKHSTSVSCQAPVCNWRLCVEGEGERESYCTEPGSGEPSQRRPLAKSRSRHGSPKAHKGSYGFVVRTSLLLGHVGEIPRYEEEEPFMYLDNGGDPDNNRPRTPVNQTLRGISAFCCRADKEIYSLPHVGTHTQPLAKTSLFISKLSSRQLSAPEQPFDPPSHLLPAYKHALGAMNHISSSDASR